MVAYNITDTNITIVIAGGLFQIPRGAPHARAVEQGIRDKVSDSALRELCNPERVLETYTSGRVKVVGNDVTFDDRPVPHCIETRIVASMRDGLPFEYLVNFMNRLDENTSNRAIEELYRFLEHKGMPITKDGHFLAYKGVSGDRFSVSGNKNTRVVNGVVDENGRIYNGDGCVIEVLRQDVDDNCNNYCSHGLHVGSHEYASGFGCVEVVVEVDPADVVSIPTDCDGQKARVSRYRVLSECQGLMGDSAKNAAAPYADLVPDVEDEDDEDAILFTKYSEDSYKDARRLQAKVFEEGRRQGYDEGYVHGTANLHEGGIW